MKGDNKMNDKNFKTHMAFKALMSENDSNSRKYDSGYEGVLPECRTCRFHRPYWKYQSCVFQACPYTSTPLSTLYG